MKMTKCTLVAALAVGTILVQGNCSAVIYDAAMDFSLASNPNSVWSYGYSTTLGAAMTLDGENFQDGNGLYVWRRSGSGQNGPAFAYNPTANPITIVGPTDLSIWNPYQLSLGPGSIYMEYCVLRFTSPGSSQYAVQGAFSSVDKYYGATTDVHILWNGSSVYDGLVAGGITAWSSFDQSVLLSAGDFLDFVVGVDGYAGGWDATGLEARVIPVPEPSLMNLFLVGLPIARVFQRRKHQ